MTPRWERAAVMAVRVLWWVVLAVGATLYALVVVLVALAGGRHAPSRGVRAVRRSRSGRFPRR